MFEMRLEFKPGLELEWKSEFELEFRFELALECEGSGLEFVSNIA